MEKLGKVENPVVIKLSHLGNCILPINGLDQEYPLNSDNEGLVLEEGSNHCGFMIVTDYNNERKEQLFYTDFEISAVGAYGTQIHVYERDKRSPWLFDTHGKLLQANEPTIDFNRKVETYTIGESIQKFSPDTITLVIKGDTNRNYIEYKGEEFTHHRGVVVGDEIYGIIIKNLITGEEKKIATEESIYGVSPNPDSLNGFLVYENGKYHPWRFNGKGEVLKEASYNPYSRQDQEYYFKKYQKELTLTQKTEEN